MRNIILNKSNNQSTEGVKSGIATPYTIKCRVAFKPQISLSHVCLISSHSPHFINP